MRRGWKILLGVVVVLAILLTLNTIAVDNETKSEVDVEGGRVVSLPAGDLQVTDTGPTRKPSKRRTRAGERPPIVLLHCYACSLRWWDRMVPILARDHRVVRLDLLGHGGSEKPSGGYSMEDQAALVAQALNRLGVEGAVVVGHSMGFDVATALAEQSSELVGRLVDIGEAPENELLDAPFLAKLNYVPVIGQAAWRLTPDFAVRDGYQEAFAPDFEMSSGFEDSDQVVHDFNAMTYTAFDDSSDRQDDFVEEVPLDQRVIGAAVPLLVIFGSEDQVWSDPRVAAEGFEDVPGVQTATVRGAGHSPNVEKPEETARLILEFAANPGDELLEHPVPKRFKRQARRAGNQE